MECLHNSQKQMSNVCVCVCVCVMANDAVSETWMMLSYNNVLTNVGMRYILHCLSIRINYYKNLSNLTITIV